MPTNLSTYPFVRTVRERAMPRLLAAIENFQANRRHDVRARAKNRARMHVADQYLDPVLRRTFGLLATFEVLDTARRMIGMSPDQLGDGADGLTRDRWVDYHYGYFTVSLVSVSDVGFLLAAEVLEIGLAPRDCRPSILLAHAAIKGSPVASALKKLSKSVEPLKARRNLHVHRAEHADVADLEPGGFLRNMKLIAAVPEALSSPRHRKLLQDLWYEAATTIVSRLDGEVEPVEAALKKLFDALFPRFTRRHDFLLQRVSKT